MNCTRSVCRAECKQRKHSTGFAKSLTTSSFVPRPDFPCPRLPCLHFFPHLGAFTWKLDTFFDPLNSFCFVEVGMKRRGLWKPLLYGESANTSLGYTVSAPSMWISEVVWVFWEVIWGVLVFLPVPQSELPRWTGCLGCSPPVGLQCCGLLCACLVCLLPK